MIDVAHKENASLVECTDLLTLHDIINCESFSSHFSSCIKEFKHVRDNLKLRLVFFCVPLTSSKNAPCAALSHVQVINDETLN